MPVVRNFTALLSGQSWVGPETLAAPTVVTYSFDRVGSDYISDFPGDNQALEDSFRQLTASQKATTRDAFDLWADVSGLRFVEVAPGQGDMRFGNYNFGTVGENGSAAFAYLPDRRLDGGGEFEQTPLGDVYVNRTEINFTSIDLMAHEIGHALGLDHPFDGDLTLATDLDNTSRTVMSYTGPERGRLGIYDIQAIQYLYGTANFQAGPAGTIEAWSFNETDLIVSQRWGNAASEIYGTSLDDIIRAGGGNDTAAGYDGDDTMLGGAGNDVFLGGGGNDRQIGQDGSDRLDGEAGNDVLIGGAGADFLFGGLGDDRLSGSADNDTLRGEGGADNLFGGAGNDLLNGGDQSDNLFGQTDDDVLSGANGDDTLNGGSGNDRLIGGNGADTLFGSNNDDRLAGGAGSDVLEGGRGNDILNGGGNNDRFVFKRGWGDDRIVDFADNGIEKIDLSLVTGIDNLGDLTISNQNGSALISFGTDSILLTGVAVGSVDAGDFLF